MDETVQCDLCGRRVSAHASYVVRIDVYAEPALPAMKSDDWADETFDDAFATLMEQMKNMSADELQDGVHRHMEYRLCPICQKEFLANPLGKPRDDKVGHN